jgi:hypothetical protein
LKRWYVRENFLADIKNRKAWYRRAKEEAFVAASSAYTYISITSSRLHPHPYLVSDDEEDAFNWG